jgi:hypothetical protein
MMKRCSEGCDHADGWYGRVDVTLRLIMLTLFRESALPSSMSDKGLRLIADLREESRWGNEIGGIDL